LSACHYLLEYLIVAESGKRYRLTLAGSNTRTAALAFAGNDLGDLPATDLLLLYR
jgi:hypothetical protein